MPRATPGTPIPASRLLLPPGRPARLVPPPGGLTAAPGRLKARYALPPELGEPAVAPLLLPRCCGGCAAAAVSCIAVCIGEGLLLLPSAATPFAAAAAAAAAAVDAGCWGVLAAAAAAAGLLGWLTASSTPFIAGTNTCRDTHSKSQQW